MKHSYQDCRMFEECDAPMCPLDPKLSRKVWFPDEDICTSRKFGPGLKWIENQRKIRKKKSDPSLCFTFEMLDRAFIVKKGIVGVSPDSKDFQGDVRKWFKQRPTITSEQAEKMRARTDVLRKKLASRQALNDLKPSRHGQTYRQVVELFYERN